MTGDMRVDGAQWGVKGRPWSRAGGRDRGSKVRIEQWKGQQKLQGVTRGDWWRGEMVKGKEELF